MALAEARHAITVADLAARYLQEVELKRKEATADLYKGYFDRYVIPEIGRLKAETVGRATIAKLHGKIGKRHPVTANRTLATLSAMFAFGEKRGFLPAGHINPARGIDRFPESARDRFLTMAELERLGAAIREAETTGIAWQVDEAKPTAKHIPKSDRQTVISPFAGAAIRLLLFTGCRLREILDLRWSEVDFERAMLHLPDSKTGKKSVILNAPALAVLASLPRLSEFVIAGDNPTQPRSDLKRPWEVVTRRAGLVGFHLHDCRHAFASVGVGASLGLPIVGELHIRVRQGLALVAVEEDDVAGFGLSLAQLKAQSHAFDLGGNLAAFQRVPGPPPTEVFFRNALDNCDLPILTPSRASISAMRRGIVQLGRSATGASSRGATTRSAASVFTGGGPGATVAFNASTPPRANSLRQRRTVSSRTLKASAMRGLVHPDNVSNIARARSASPRPREWANVSSALRCWSPAVTRDLPATPRLRE